MSLLEQASLVVTPNGYKAGTLFSVVPNAPIGDLTVVRATTATRVNSDGLIESVLANIPRLDYLNSSCPRLLLEPQRTNLALYSEQIDNAGWTKSNSPTITTNIATAPDGYGGADGIQSVTGGSYRTINQNFSVSANSTITGSVFIKKETSETAFGGLGIIFQGGTTKTCYTIFNAVTGTGLISGSSLTGTIKVDDYGNYWRLQVTTTDNGSNTTLNFSYYSTLSADGVILNPSAGSVRTVWGFQLEIGESYATSYIGPTLGASVTRGADAVSKTGISSLIGQTEGVIFIDFEIQTSGQDMAVMNIYNGTTPANSMYFYLNSSNVLVGYVDNSGTQVTISTGVLAQGRYKAALAYKSNDFAFYLNGSLIGVDVSGTVPTCNALRLENYAPSPTYQEKIAVNQAILFKTRLSNADLAALTTL